MCFGILELLLQFLTFGCMEIYIKDMRQVNQCNKIGKLCGYKISPGDTSFSHTNFSYSNIQCFWALYILGIQGKITSIKRNVNILSVWLEAGGCAALCRNKCCSCSRRASRFYHSHFFCDILFFSVPSAQRTRANNQWQLNQRILYLWQKLSISHRFTAHMGHFVCLR